IPVNSYLPRWVSRRIRERDPTPPLSHSLVVSWSGMRGAVSLAAALALPLTTHGGHPFAQRNLIVFLTFCVILGTLVFQGLTLPDAERGAIVALRHDGVINDDVMHRLTRDLDLEDARLDI